MRRTLLLAVLLWNKSHGNVGAFLSAPAHTSAKPIARDSLLQTSATPSWRDLESSFGSSYDAERPLSINSVLQPETPSFSTERPTLFRENHGWCPYSERAWLTLELKNADYDTIRIDNTGGPRPSYYAGTTPQLRWPDGSTQGESLDLMRDLDAYYNGDGRMNLCHQDADVQHAIGQFRNIFPRRARPSSRAAFLFQGNGDPLWRSTFEETLQGTDEFLGKSTGPFFCGDSLSSADVAWAPFLERYRYQLPCLHEGLRPFNVEAYPNLFAWYIAMDRVPAYACRVKGDASSWRKVLTMAGFGNAGLPPTIEANMDDLTKQEAATASDSIDQELWTLYASTRPFLAETSAAEAAQIMTKNRKAILADTLKRSSTSPWRVPTSEADLDLALRSMVQILLSGDEDAKNVPGVGALAGFLDERMCVPRDMGAPSAASIKQLAWELSGY